MPVLKHLKRMFTDWFLCGMLLATFLAYVFPHFGSTGGAMHAEWVINIGVFLVFFLHRLGWRFGCRPIVRGPRPSRRVPGPVGQQIFPAF